MSKQIRTVARLLLFISMKRIFTRILLVCLLFLTVQTAYAYDFEVDGIYYSKSKTSQKEVSVTYCTTASGYLTAAYSGDVVIPATVTYSHVTYNVTSISMNSFKNCYNVTSVKIPNSVTSISMGAFEKCIRLTSIEIPNSVKDIDLYAFKGCSSLINVIIEDGNESLSLGYNKMNNSGVGQGLFHDCPLTTLYIGRTLSYRTNRSYGYSPFYGQTSLTSVTISEYVKSIGETLTYTTSNLASNIFDGCKNLKKLIIKDSNNSLIIGSLYYSTKNSMKGRGLFYDCPLDTLYLGRDLIYNSGYDYGYSPFYGKDLLSSVIISDSVQNISQYLFSGCTKLTAIDIPKNVNSINTSAFGNCNGLMAVNVASENKKYSSINGLLLTHEKDTLIFVPQGLTSLEVPNSVTSITDYAISACTGLWQANGVYGTYSTITMPSATKWEIKGAEYGVLYDSKLYQGGDIIDSLSSGTYYSGICPVIVLTNGNKSLLSSCSFQTKDISTSLIISDSSPTKMAGSFSLTKGDAIESITEQNITYKGTKISIKENEKNFSVYGLEPSTSYTFQCIIKLSDGRSKSSSRTATTPSLELTTLQPKVVNSTCAIAAATTNISEEEKNVGFQWKKYDAPETLSPNEGYTAIYDGQLEGYIKNLQPTYYNVRAFYKSDAGTYYYGDWVTFDQTDFSYFEPTVHTYDATDITYNSAKLKGYVMQGTDDVTAQGFEYWLASSSAAKAMVAYAPSATDKVTTVLATGQVMTATLENLQPSAEYSCRAFVTTANGTTYGEEQIFVTKEDASAIYGVQTDKAEPTIIGYYDLQGRRLSSTVKGVNIIKYSDGTARKVYVKR